MVSEKLKDIPKNSGCYLFKDEKEQIIYVGMSKFLPKRVKSYFQKKHTDKKTETLVENIKDIDFIITTTTEEALLLEEELIRTYKPRFNIKCKDDRRRSMYLYFSNENFPKLNMSREMESEFIPRLEFTNSQLCYEVNDLIHDIFNLRTCSYNLSEENVKNNKFKNCLEYHLNRCNAPCIGLQKNFEYLQEVLLVKLIFEFDYSKIKSFLIKKMNDYSKNLEFEKANSFLHKVSKLEELIEKLKPVRKNHVTKKANKIKGELGLKNLPIIVEAFDNSHHAGDYNVAASVRFVDENPDKSQYRKYNIKTVSGVNDYASFDEVLTRRFSRLIEEKQQLPHLVLIDGGIGQLNVAKKVFENLNLLDKVDLISISKNDRHQSSIIHTIDGRKKLMTESTNFVPLARIQDEVHRFAIKFHREKKSKIKN
jgi:excinuclease ABC subunit C